MIFVDEHCRAYQTEDLKESYSAVNMLETALQLVKTEWSLSEAPAPIQC